MARPEAVTFTSAREWHDHMRKHLRGRLENRQKFEVPVTTSQARVFSACGGVGGNVACSWGASGGDAREARPRYNKTPTLAPRAPPFFSLAQMIGWNPAAALKPPAHGRLGSKETKIAEAQILGPRHT